MKISLPETYWKAVPVTGEIVSAGVVGSLVSTFTSPLVYVRVFPTLSETTYW